MTIPIIKLVNYEFVHNDVNKVSYRKQIARQHSWCDRVKICLTSSLITVQNLVAVSHSVCANVGGSKKFGGGWGPASREGAWQTP